ncbi:hypothetical protein GPECTOR_11g147 [Gonium pectorale]|uniref:Uncharacterized protein n=1 Tax=Gonium pectorale TaxID=33097 RepID=A0A150GPE4_GONPE|nr:hypothetical protein GPECTOR_11g147 [Gonium pectorale]|eukprot:KXZ51697.1 hypothetical protein GPECTOR_11g147 [Gonium pectorale]
MGAGSVAAVRLRQLDLASYNAAFYGDCPCEARGTDAGGPESRDAGSSAVAHTAAFPPADAAAFLASGACSAPPAPMPPAATTAASGADNSIWWLSDPVARSLAQESIPHPVQDQYAHLHYRPGDRLCDEIVPGLVEERPRPGDRFVRPLKLGQLDLDTYNAAVAPDGMGGASGVDIHGKLSDALTEAQPSRSPGIPGVLPQAMSAPPQLLEKLRPEASSMDIDRSAASGGGARAATPRGRYLANESVPSVLPEPVTVQVASRGRNVEKRRTDSGRGSKPTARGAVGIFYPKLYLSGGDCIECDGELMSRGRFERLAGTATAKWHVSIKVLPSGVTLGRWLREHGIPVLQGKPRLTKLRRRQGEADRALSASVGHYSPHTDLHTLQEEDEQGEEEEEDTQSLMQTAAAPPVAAPSQRKAHTEQAITATAAAARGARAQAVTM